MESHLSKLYTLAELEPGWPEDVTDRRAKTTPRNHGSMRMALRRVSRNPENTRIYTRGDPVHMIDWKAYARTDELILREHRDEASAKVAIVLDWRASMDWPSKQSVREHGGIDSAVSKREVETRVGFYLAFNHLIAGDTVVLGFLDDKGDVSTMYRPRGPADVMALFEMGLKEGFTRALDGFSVAGAWSAHGFDRIWWVSDFLSSEKAPADWSSLRSLAVIHVFSWLELDTAWMDDPTSYRENTGVTKIHLGSELKAGERWREQVTGWQAKVKRAVTQAGGKYIAVSDRTSVGDFFHWLSHEVSDS